jgi:hypothetical protein
MLIEAKLLRRALDGELNELLGAGFDPVILRPPYSEVFAKLIGFHRKYQEMPSDKRLLAECEDLGAIEICPKGQAKSKARVYWDQISEKTLLADYENTMEEVIQKYNERKSKPADLLWGTIQSLRKIVTKHQSTNVRVFAPNDLAQTLWANYVAATKGEMPGIAIPDFFRNPLIDAFGKWAPGNITTFVARSGVGKTWMVLILVLHALMTGTKVLFASMEMTEFEILRRLSALAANVDFDRVVKGGLIPDQEKRFVQVIEDIYHKRGFWENLRLMNPAAIRDIDTVETQADIFGAQLVAADAFYDFPEKGQDQRWQKIDENLQAVRQYSLATKRHWFLTAQFNRMADSPSTSDEFAVGGSDTFNKISNNVVMLIQGRSEKKQLQIIIKVNKGRDAAPVQPYIYNWNFRGPNYAVIRVWQSVERHTKILNKRFAG